MEKSEHRSENISSRFTTEANVEKDTKCEKYRLVSRESNEYAPEDEDPSYVTG